MNLDKCLINGLVFDTELSESERLRYLQVADHEFSTKNEVVIKFIRTHYRQNYKIPGAKLLREKFPGFEFVKNEEPYKYYITEAVTAKQLQAIRAVTSKVDNLVAKGDPQAAISALYSGSTGMRRFEIESQDLNLKSQFGVFVSNYKVTRDEGGQPGIPLGIKKLDSETYGVQPGDFWIIGARPASYKTFLMCYSFCYVAQEIEAPILFFSKEMTKEQIMRRCYAIVGGVSFGDLRRWKLSNSELAKIEFKIKKLRGDLIVIGHAGDQLYNADYIRAKVTEYGTPISFLDGAYMLGTSAEWKDQASMVQEMRAVPLETNSGLVASSQMNRKGGRNATIDNLQLSDAYGQYASVVLSLERPLDEADKPMRQVAIKSIKVRDDESHNVTHLRIGFNKSQFVEGPGPDIDSMNWADTAAEEMVREATKKKTAGAKR